MSLPISVEGRMRLVKDSMSLMFSPNTDISLIDVKDHPVFSDLFHMEDNVPCVVMGEGNGDSVLWYF